MSEDRHTDFYEKRKKGKFRLVEPPDTSFPVADTHCHFEMFEDPAWNFVRCAVHNVKFIACVIDSTDDGAQGMSKVEAAYEEAYLGSGVAMGSGVSLPGALDKTPGKDTPNPMVTPDPVKLRYIVGTHPHHAKKWDDAQEKNLREMLKNPKVSCVGEIGLDYHYDFSPKKDQIDVFKQQLKIADELGFPVSLHLREAHDDALKIFEEVGFCKHGTLLHCFNLGPEDLKPWVEAGCYIAIGGPVTFKKFDWLREAVKLIPQDKLLTETDAPFMTPEPMRGMTCWPDHVIFVADMLCKILGQEDNREKFYARMYQNALDLLDR